MSTREKFTVTAIAYGGEALGRLDSGEVCFVRGALPGEKAEVEITERKKRFARGKLIALSDLSPKRVPPPCPYAGECPGCSFQHCTYDLELEWKQRQFERFLQEFPGTRLPIFPSPARFGWRNRLKVACEKGKAGYRGFDNTTLLPIDKCFLAHPEINKAFARTTIPEEGSLFFRATSSWCGEIGSFEGEYLTETLPGSGDFLVPKAGFFQTNPAVAAELCSRVTGAISHYGARRMLELFCGTGVFSLAAAAQIQDFESCGIELSKESIAAAKLNAQQRNLANRCRFESGDAGNFPQKGDFDTVLLDPPRSGVEKQLIKKLLKAPVPLLLYISCGPDTLRRDLEMLSEKYTVVQSGALDMFPCTAHFETFTILTLPN